MNKILSVHERPPPAQKSKKKILSYFNIPSSDCGVVGAFFPVAFVGALAEVKS